MARELVNVIQAAKRAGVSRRTIYNWMQTGKVSFVKTAGGTRRIFADTLFDSDPAGNVGPVHQPEPAVRPAAVAPPLAALRSHDLPFPLGPLVPEGALPWVLRTLGKRETARR